MVTVPPLSRMDACVIDRHGNDARAGVWFAHVPDRPDIPLAVFRAVDLRELRVVEPQLGWEVVSQSKNRCTVRVTANAFAHAVHMVDADDVHCSDNYFDLLPAQAREIEIELPDKRRAEDMRFAAVAPQLSD
jgi:hypothetical protein